ncbi:uncharacterized protein LOC126322597 [Schistocerca gregaria]|uniref:uncharacterized protein LOC126322597 n=1 Tax=Schistocerca gregaria TaxID=7010 RepID=UPI00211DE0F2|nr:uncharacterized protein LOC126322597 [Schistocerca gregaria]XP_049850421.1 uncharacterized protein LOC126322597 [Schistocerca gregaria]XP_049850423.1 uncharacterized protein LOC126322597 [Schistocerca gregaria]XP_049850424.1 uncharacterized protein LOC126322597 [Schistocerca gregaria]
MISLWHSSKRAYEKLKPTNYQSRIWKKNSQLLCYRMYGSDSVWQQKLSIARLYTSKWMGGQAASELSKEHVGIGLNKRNMCTRGKGPRDNQEILNLLNNSSNDSFGLNAKNSKSPSDQYSSSTLKNLESLYAAFAKQQKQKEKISDIQDSDPASSFYLEDTQDTSQDSDEYFDEMDDIPSGDPFVKEFEEYTKKYQPSNDMLSTEFNPLYLKGDDIDVIGENQIKEFQASGMLASWEDLPPNLKPIDKEAEWKYFVQSNLNLSPSTDESLLSVDDASPELRESFERHIAQLQENLEADSQRYEEKLIEKHHKEVEAHSWILNYLDTSKTQDTAPLKEDMNPFLYNEKYHVGLSFAELSWLKMRSKWKKLVEQKRTKIAIAKRDQMKSDSSIDSLFIDTVNMLANNPSCQIHPMDIKNRERAFIARERLQRKLREIWEKHPVQWMELLNKYLPRSTGIAEKVNNREFWNPTNPWILTAFTRSLIEESDMIEKKFGLSELDRKIASRLKAEQENSSAKMSTTYRTTQYGSYHANRGCLFCGPNRHRFPLEVMNVPLLARYLNQAGKILGRKVTGLCKKHQKKITKTIKYARHLNLFTYKKSLFEINNPYLNAKRFGTPILGYKIYTNPLDPTPRRKKKKQKTISLASLQELDKSDVPSSETMKSENLKSREAIVFERVMSKYDQPTNNGVDTETNAEKVSTNE